MTVSRGWRQGRAGNASEKAKNIASKEISTSQRESQEARLREAIRLRGIRLRNSSWGGNSSLGAIHLQSSAEFVVVVRLRLRVEK